MALSTRFSNKAAAMLRIDTRGSMSTTELGRMMNLQGVTLRTMAKKISGLGRGGEHRLCDCPMGRMREEYQKFH